tara:strand:+ start:4194 stop:4646 length:453 start_codon:yes stop_codon:yes gene_type:complete
MEEQQTKSSGLGRKMAIQRITNKRIIKHDTNSPNFKPLPKVEEQVDGNSKENFEEDVYGERIYQVPTESNGNLKLEEMMSKMMGKLDGINGSESQTGTEAIEVDIQREIAISKVDMNAVKSEVIKGKVLTKKDKLKALRIRERRRNGDKV